MKFDRSNFIFCALTFIFDYLNPYAARARAVELAKEDGLPPPKLQFAVFDGNRLARTRHQRLDVRVRVALGVAIITFGAAPTFEARS